MNIHCINCAHLRMEARVRAGSAGAGFLCAFDQTRMTYLLRGPNPKCFVQRDGNTIAPEALSIPDFREHRHG